MAYRSVNPRPLRDVSGDVVLVTGAGGLYSSIGYLWVPASVFFGTRKKIRRKTYGYLQVLLGITEPTWIAMSEPWFAIQVMVSARSLL